MSVNITRISVKKPLVRTQSGFLGDLTLILDCSFCQNHILRVEITLVRIEITVMSVVITFVRVKITLRLEIALCVYK
jgi:hypothetical protein